MPTLYLIDGHAQFFRAYYAIRTSMTSPVTGEPTSMVYGFTAMLVRLLRDQCPDYLAVVIDAAGDQETFRSEIYEDYKANRDEAPEDFSLQVDRCIELLDRLHIPVLGIPGVEADDTIATLVRRHQNDDDLTIRIISRDKDLTQLIGPNVEMFDAHKEAIVTPSDVFKTDGVEPSMVRDILALMGDTVDNVPGVPGIGPKTAAKLILQYGDIEGIYDHLDEIKGKRHDNLAQSREVVELARELVSLIEDAAVEFDLDDATWDPLAIDVSDIKGLFRELGFGRLQDEIALLATGDPRSEAVPEEESRQSAPSMAGTLFDTGPDRSFACFSAGYEIISDLDALTAFIDKARQEGILAIDTETTALHPMRAELCGISASLGPGHGVYVPVRSPEQDTHLGSKEVVKAFKSLLAEAKTTIIGHNLKYDLIVLCRAGINVQCRMLDTMIAAYVDDATRSSYGMDPLALAEFEYTCLPISDLIGRGKHQIPFDQVSLESAVPYAAEDADITYRLWNVLEPRIAETDLHRLFEEVEMPLVALLADMEQAGVRVDRDELSRQEDSLRARIGELHTEIAEVAPHPFNPDSPKQLAAVLFNPTNAEQPGLGLAPVKKRKTGPSTDAEVLEKLDADESIDTPLPGLILESRRLTKLVSTYLVALAEAINPETGRVHASFHQTGTETGRLSSSDPNLQNIPIRTAVGREIRRAFVAESGFKLVTADYSQVELRMLAHLSRDDALIAAFEGDEDIHRAVAAEVFEVPLTDVTSEQRSAAKMVNFGIIYGVSAWGLARRLGADVARAKSIIDDYKARFPGMSAFLQSCIAQAQNEGWVDTILHRRRRIANIDARNPMQRGLAERQAINSVVQGSAADLIKVAMLRVHERLPGTSADARLVLQVHDELVIEAPGDAAEAVKEMMVETMESAMDLVVPLRADATIAECWADTK